jgi:hypothetical protein
MQLWGAAAWIKMSDRYMTNLAGGSFRTSTPPTLNLLLLLLLLLAPV